MRMCVCREQGVQLRFGILFYCCMEAITVQGAAGARMRAHTRSSRAMAPPGGQRVPLLGRAGRAQEEGTGVLAGAGPGQAREPTALLREVNAHPRRYFPLLPPASPHSFSGFFFSLY